MQIAIRNAERRYLCQDFNNRMAFREFSIPLKPTDKAAGRALFKLESIKNNGDDAQQSIKLPAGGYMAIGWAKARTWLNLTCSKADCMAGMSKALRFGQRAFAQTYLTDYSIKAINGNQKLSAEV